MRPHRTRVNDAASESPTGEDQPRTGADSVEIRLDVIHFLAIGS